jgi:hypothetical protein
LPISGRYELGTGEVLRLCETGGLYVEDVVFDSRAGRRLETLPVQRLERAVSPWDKLRAGQFDNPRDFLLRQLAWQFALGNTGGELTNSRTQLLPHQILLTHDVIKMPRRRLLIADEVGLGKTVETGMIIRELIARGEAHRVLILCPAGLVKNWQNELRGCFRLEFEVLGVDFQDFAPASWENHQRVIASIDTVKRPARMGRLLNAPRFDLVIVDEARDTASHGIEPIKVHQLRSSGFPSAVNAPWTKAAPMQSDWTPATTWTPFRPPISQKRHKQEPMKPSAFGQLPAALKCRKAPSFAAISSACLLHLIL